MHKRGACEKPGRMRFFVEKMCCNLILRNQQRKDDLDPHQTASDELYLAYITLRCFCCLISQLLQCGIFWICIIFIIHASNRESLYIHFYYNLQVRHNSTTKNKSLQNVQNIRIFLLNVVLWHVISKNIIVLCKMETIITF